jgi:hypothetical protein
MSIRARIEEAMFLWKHGRVDGAFLNALVAVAATSRRRYPKATYPSDRAAFEQFLTDAHTVRISVEYRGEHQAVEHILYKWLRCQLLHEGELPPDIKFMPDVDPNSMLVRAGGPPEYVLKMSYGWFDYLVASVVQARENEDLFADVTRAGA